MDSSFLRCHALEWVAPLMYPAHVLLWGLLSQIRGRFSQTFLSERLPCSPNIDHTVVMDYEFYCFMDELFLT